METTILTIEELNSVKISDFELKKQLQASEEERADYAANPFPPEIVEEGGAYYKRLQEMILFALEEPIKLINQILKHRDETKTNVTPTDKELEGVKFRDSGMSFEDIH